MGMHRSVTPTDSCSAPTSPASQNISPSNSPELPINSNGTQTNVSNQPFTNSYSSYSNQQTNILHQLEQFRMTNDTDTASYMVLLIRYRYHHIKLIKFITDMQHRTILSSSDEWTEFECILP